MKNNEFTHYQTRVTKFIWAGNLYSILCPILLWYFDAPFIGWIVYLSTLVIQYSLAAISDAVFDSLNERINIQSSWLNVRLKNIEDTVRADSGQDLWKENGIPTDDTTHYFYNYPEKLEFNEKYSDKNIEQ